MLRHVDLGRRETHQRRDRERAGGTFHPPRKESREQQSQDAEERRDRVEGGERFRAEELVPKIGRENVEEPNRRQNGTG